MIDMRARNTTLALAVAVAVALAGCAVTPTPSPDEIRQDALEGLDVRPGWSAGHAAAGAIKDNWLATFDDPQLSRLVDEAVVRNLDLRVAAARVEQSAAYAQIAQAALRPNVNLAGTGGISGSGGADLSSALQGIMLAVSWEPDLWGRLRYGRAAAEESYTSAQADFEFARQSIAAQVARSWFIMIESRLQLAAAESMVESARTLVKLAEDRQRVGIGGERDVTLARASLNSFEDTARQAQQSLEQATRSLELIVGRYPAAELQPPDALPPLPAQIPVGMPLEMLERRPDMVAAERRVAAAFNRVGEAKAAQLPQLRLNASISALDSDILDLADDYDNPSYGAGATLLAPLYLGGALKAQVAVRTAEQGEALANYASQALRAIGDVENALAASRILEERVALLSQGVVDQERTLELDQASFRVGRQDLRAVQQQQQLVQTARMALLRARSEQLIQRVNLHLSLGGSFMEPMTATVSNP
jgi:NodT family efflux transporter outer membrane factor (OMF) lipoprotein